MPKKIIIATSNKGKRAEISDLLRSTPVELVFPDEISLSLEVEENGSTYEENACLKALAYCKASGLPALADDTGLEVEALNGQPGLHSARFSSDPNATDSDRRKLLLTKLSGHVRPWKARFVCAVVLALPSGDLCTYQDFCGGEIIPEERGTQGFGYDSIFLVGGTGKTMSEMSMREKNRISHRARAVKGIIPYLDRL